MPNFSSTYKEIEDLWNQFNTIKNKYQKYFDITNCLEKNNNELIIKCNAELQKNLFIDNLSIIEDTLKVVTADTDNNFGITLTPYLIGSQGDTGEAGIKGEQGVQGIQGPVGDKGPTGSFGPVGDRGEQGDKGMKGETGPVGFSGPPGDKGPYGFTNIKTTKNFYNDVATFKLIYPTDKMIPENVQEFTIVQLNSNYKLVSIGGFISRPIGDSQNSWGAGEKFDNEFGDSIFFIELPFTVAEDHINHARIYTINGETTGLMDGDRTVSRPAIVGNFRLIEELPTYTPCIKCEEDIYPVDMIYYYASYVTTDTIPDFGNQP